MKDFAWLQSRTLDPLKDDKYKTIERLQIKQRLDILLREFESLTGLRILITDGYAKNGHNPGSLHYIGKAVDIVFLEPDTWAEKRLTPEQFQRLLKPATQFSFELIDEYTNPSPAATGGHYHLEYVK